MQKCFYFSSEEVLHIKEVLLDHKRDAERLLKIDSAHAELYSREITETSKLIDEITVAIRTGY